MQQEQESLQVSGATRVTLMLVAATSFHDFQNVSADPASRCQEYLAPIQEKPYTHLKAFHEQDHREMFKRVRFDPGPSEYRYEPTDKR